MKRLFITSLLALACSLPACQGGQSRLFGFHYVHHGYETMTEPVRTVYTGWGREALFAGCLEVLEGLEIPVETAEADKGEIRSGEMAAEGVSWRVNVRVIPDDEAVAVETFMEIRRHTDSESRLVETVLDAALDLDPEEELRDLEENHEKGWVPEHEYREERDRLEAEIEAREAERSAEWKEADRARIEGVTRREALFFDMLDDHLRRRRVAEEAGE